MAQGSSAVERSFDDRGCHEENTGVTSDLLKRKHLKEIALDSIWSVSTCKLKKPGDLLVTN